MVDLGMPVRKAFGLAARERFSGSGQPTQANSQYRSAPYLPNPHRNYDTSGRRVFPPQYDRADGNRMALEARRGDSNLITGGMFDLTIGLGASPGTASLLTGSASFIPGVDTATSLDDARRNLDAGNFGSATIDILLATGGFIPGAGKFFRKVIERGGKRFISTKHGGINFDLLPGNALDFG